MSGGRFEVELRSLLPDGSVAGNEQVEFLVATNPGAEPRALAKVASGGELSRLSLAIQVITSRAATGANAVLVGTPTTICQGARRAIEKNVADWWSDEEARAGLDADPLNPEYFFWELSSRVPERSVFAVDTGMSTTFFARAVKMRTDMKIAISGTLATMGPAVSFAAAAKFAFPDRPAFAFVGDGAMQMLGLNALVTVAKYWKRWRDPRPRARAGREESPLAGRGLPRR